MLDVLIVDDEPQFRRLMHRWVEGMGMSAAEAESAEQALLLASQEPPKVALCDINMPRGQTGMWLIEQLQQLHPDTAIVVTSGTYMIDMTLPDTRARIVDFMLKPFTRDQMRQVLMRGLSEHEARQAASRALSELDGRGGLDEYAVSIAALAAVLQSEDEGAARHASRVAQMAGRLARTLAVRQESIPDIERAALLRNVRRLDVHGFARTVPFLAAAEAVVAAVDERFDGRGFPLGLRGDSIPVGARILAVAEAFDTMVAGATKHRLPSSDAVRVLSTTRATEFDPAVLEALNMVAAEPGAQVS
jgi:response regulator RpfG family c-di-GMP phosphodiesterase